MKLLQLLQKFCPPPGNRVIREQVEKAALRINLPQETKQKFYQGIEVLKLFLSSAADRIQTEVNG